MQPDHRIAAAIGRALGKLFSLEEASHLAATADWRVRPIFEKFAEEVERIRLAQWIVEREAREKVMAEPIGIGMSDKHGE